MINKVRGLLAVLGLAAILAGLPWLLLAVHHIGSPRLGWTLQGLRDALLSPDDGTLAFTLLKIVGWIVWAILTIAIAVELWAQLQRHPAPRLRGLRLPQRLARQMVGAAAALFVAATPLTAGPPGLAGPATPAQVQESASHEHPSIQRHNQPHLARGSVTTYTVKKGDTLSAIALAKTGRAANYPRIFDASTAIRQPGGRHLSDPDEIDIGWTLKIPKLDNTGKSRDTSQRAHDGHPKGETAAPARTPTPASPTPSPVHATPTPVGTARAGEPDIAAAGSTTPPAGDVSPGWLLTGLAGAGGLLAGAAWLALRRRRASQFRARRPGRGIVHPEPRLAPVEKTVTREGAPTAALVLFIDEVLRRLASHLTESAGEVPSLVGVDATPERLTLRFRHSTDLPEPCLCLDDAERQIWQVDRDADLARLGNLEADGAAPWPQLVTLGSDAVGWRLINLESVGVLSLTGDPLYVEDLARYLISELAISPWARDVEIDCLAVCSELPGLAPARIHFHTEPGAIDRVIAAAVATVDRLAEASTDTLETARVNYAGDDLWDSRVLITATSDSDHLNTLNRLVTDQLGRTATSVILAAPDAKPVGLELRLTPEGRLQVPSLKLDLIANGLTQAEARGCVAILTAGEAQEDPDIPVATETSAGQEWAGLCNQAGALLAELTVPRGSAAPDSSSILPAPDETYLAVTANTVDDLAALAPQVLPQTRARIEAADPNLDADLDQWWADSCDRPRLRTLGTLKVRLGRSGNAVKAASRIGLCTEMVAYLHSRPKGVTTTEVADALGVSIARVRKDASVVRGWLGVSPTTGEPFLPPATKKTSDQGTGLYLIEDLLCDEDLFRRLRMRGESRGADGLEDLRLALRLVAGTPYDGIRARGGAWLAESRIDQHLLCAIVDVAHTVSTITLEQGNLQQARAAAELAALAAPDEVTPQLDLAAIANQEGDTAAAARIARAAISGRVAGAEPTDPPDRAEAILRAHRWLAQAS
ncbi:MAG: LysM peptidoglycan-binding domain-containing protein [Micropruina sp.]|jgi:LysM domain-containing protein|nr:LysM peptidoglycan-binding domain-containing protein [Micropruina sp.]